jgi:Bacteriocin-protection, YdeI or OmpD-Associated
VAAGSFVVLLGNPDVLPGGKGVAQVPLHWRGQRQQPATAVPEQVAETGDQFEVQVEPDNASQDISLPADFAEALSSDRAAGEFFGRLSPSQQKGHIQSIEAAKTPETRQRRIARSGRAAAGATRALIWPRRRTVQYR